MCPGKSEGQKHIRGSELREQETAEKETCLLRKRNYHRCIQLPLGGETTPKQGIIEEGGRTGGCGNIPHHTHRPTLPSGFERINKLFQDPQRQDVHVIWYTHTPFGSSVSTVVLSCPFHPGPAFRGSSEKLVSCSEISWRLCRQTLCPQVLPSPSMNKTRQCLSTSYTRVLYFQPIFTRLILLLCLL